MSQNESIILSVVHRKLPVAQVAKQFGVSRAWVYKLLARYQKEGDSAFVAASRRPKPTPGLYKCNGIRLREVDLIEQNR